MKILIILKKWGGGVGTVIKNVQKELQLDGHQVKTISREDDLNISSLVKSIFLLGKKIKILENKNKFNIIYTQDWSLAFPLFFPYPLFIKKHFCMFHGTEPGKLKWMQGLIGRLLGKKLIVADSINKKRFKKSNFNPNGVNLEEFFPLKKQRKFLGWIKKGSEIIQEGEIKKLSKIVNIPLLIAQNIKREEMNEKFYNKLKLFLSFPIRKAGCQLSYMEAMAAGVPKIIGNKNGEGWKYPFEKEENFLNLIEAIKDSKERNYRRWLEKNDLTWKKHSEKLIQIFKQHL
jgi:hypothetical protein